MGEKTADIKKPESVRFFAHFKQLTSRIQGHFNGFFTRIIIAIQ
jgi:hypothetical protein